MKVSKRYWRMISLTGVILACVFLTACGGEVQETAETSQVLSASIDFEHETAREAAFSQAVDILENTGFLPDGRYCYIGGDADKFKEDKQRAYSNKSAIYDVDEDGEE